jgi:hypothetical protein
MPPTAQGIWPLYWEAGNEEEDVIDQFRREFAEHWKESRVGKLLV